MRSMNLTVTYEADKNGNRTGDIYHLIRVYLIDRDGWVREIYATGFFDPDVVVNDIKTLVMEGRAKN
jgi:cytochrome oxidase Cu insertion factor (SCO1/SenC/PrrC family)